ncbi:MAG: hypothetical protein EXR76_14145 [Myxococcales bacterium]|nr:hypothetical protein [Myxococcales bacterium]
MSCIRLLLVLVTLALQACGTDSPSGLSPDGSTPDGSTPDGSTPDGPVDDCAGVICAHDGACVDGVNGFTCDCQPGYAGRLCESERCGDANFDNGDGCSAVCRLEPLSFSCAILNDQMQEAAAPKYPVHTVVPAGVTIERLSTSPAMMSQRFTWEPVLEEVPGCNGLSRNSWPSDDFLMVLDDTWIRDYNAHAAEFARHGYASLEASPGILLDRVGYLFERQFGVRVGRAAWWPSTALRRSARRTSTVMGERTI